MSVPTIGTIRETLVVEGRRDVAAVQRAGTFKILTTEGFGLMPQARRAIRRAYRRTGLLLLLDPDSAGDKIRRRLMTLIGPCKHAHLPREQARREDNVGVENASPEAILRAISHAREWRDDRPRHFGRSDLVRFGLSGPEAMERRRQIGEALHIGGCSEPTFLRRLHHLGVTPAELYRALNEVPL